MVRHCGATPVRAVVERWGDRRRRRQHGWGAEFRGTREHLGRNLVGRNILFLSIGLLGTDLGDHEARCEKRHDCGQRMRRQGNLRGTRRCCGRRDQSL